MDFAIFRKERNLIIKSGNCIKLADLVNKQLINNISDQYIIKKLSLFIYLILLKFELN